MKRIVWLVALMFALLLPLMAEAQQTPPAPASQPAPAKTSASQPSSATQGNPDAQVWVNTNSGVYHCSGTHWYGTTKSGVYMKQSEAQQKGFRPAYHRVCK
ncbi:MAG TPA: hypothetical protein VL240_14890 [Candidatus Binatia bacterium]|nr:hypothetical protein [Candidatus Binatia bacterium]